MTFDPSTARPVEFDPATARPVEPPRTNPLLENAFKLSRGFLQAGPLGLAAAGVGGAMQTIDKASYEAGGLATDVAAKILPPEGAAAVGTAVNVGVPSVVGSQLAKTATSMFETGARKLMQQALKPSIKALKLGSGDEAINTMLKEGINVSRGGVAKLEGKIDDLNDQITTLLQQRSKETIDKGQVATRIQDVVKRIEGEISTPQDALKNVEKVYTDFMANDLIPKNIPVQQAQKLKQGIYRMLKDKYGQLQSESVEAQKALGRGYKELVAEKIPEVSQLNAKESKLIEALALAEHRALQAGNRDLAGIGWLVKHPEAAAGFLADRSPLFKSIIARLMYSGKENIPSAIGAAAGGTYQTIQSNK